MIRLIRLWAALLMSLEKYSTPFPAKAWSTLFRRDTPHGLGRGKRFFKKNDIIAVGGWVVAEVSACATISFISSSDLSTTHEL